MMVLDPHPQQHTARSQTWGRSLTLKAHLLVLILVTGIIAIPILPRAHAITGTYFDNVVIVAMENQKYADVMGTGTGSSNAPFIASLLPLGSTIPNYHAYGANGRNTCATTHSAGCYEALIAGVIDLLGNGYSCCIPDPTLLGNRLPTAGLTWQAYCESGCPRGNDHFPFTGFSDTPSCSCIFKSSSVSTSDFVAAANSATPPNFLWFTPTDNHNMHDNSIQTGDTYLHNFFVGSTGSVASPASGSLLASNLFTPGHRTMLLVWWDEYDPAPILFYAPGIVKQTYISPSGVYDEFSILHTLENNWALSTLTANDAAAAPMTEIFGSSPPLPLATSFSFTPLSPAVNTPVTFTASATGGTSPYSFSWNFGDGATGAGSTVTHAYTAAGTYSVIETGADGAAHTATSTLSVTVTPPQPLSATFTISPVQPTNGTTATFTATATGGTSPYSFAWSFGDGSSGTTNPATHVYAVPGTFTASLLATDAKAATFTTSKSVMVIQSVKSGAFPYVRAWDGILPTESTADLQATFTLLQQRGYNAARISLVDPVLAVSTFNKPGFDNLLSIAKQHNIWLIMDDHEYGITDEAAWLSFWSPIITAYKNEPMIIWQPRNEPSNSAAQLSTFYQDWITQDRSLGDNHWIIVSISYSQFGAPNDSTFLSAFPTVTDPLHQVAYDFHDYYFYQYHPAWSVSDAQAYAANVPLAVQSLEAFKNAPAIVSEFGADPSGGGPSPPDAVNTNCSCQYSAESLAYVVAVIQGLDNIKGAYGLWEAGDWDASGLATGAMTVWGQSIPMPGPVSTVATYTLTFQGYDFDGANEETITMNGNLVASVPPVLTTANGATWVAFTFDITSFVVQGANTLSFTHANSDCPTNDQVRNLVVSNQTSASYTNATAENINTATNR